MRRLIAVALAVGLVAVPACAQRGGARGGGGGFHGGGFGGRGGFASGYGGVGRAYGVRPYAGGARPGFYGGGRAAYGGAGAGVYGARAGAYGARAGVYGARPQFYHRGGWDRRRGYGYGAGVGYGYVGPWDYGWLDADDWDDGGDDGSYGDSDVAAQGDGEQTSPYYAGAEGYAGPDSGAEDGEIQGGDGYSVPDAGYAGPVVRAQGGAASAGLYDSSAVTLVFKDGRAPERIHNYALTRTMVYVTDTRRQEIPVASLDLAATERVNRAAGVSFQLPVGQ